MSEPLQFLPRGTRHMRPLFIESVTCSSFADAGTSPKPVKRYGKGMVNRLRRYGRTAKKRQLLNKKQSKTSRFCVNRSPVTGSNPVHPAIRFKACWRKPAGLFLFCDRHLNVKTLISLVFLINSTVRILPFGLISPKGIEWNTASLSAGLRRLPAGLPKPENTASTAGRPGPPKTACLPGGFGRPGRPPVQTRLTPQPYHAWQRKTGHAAENSLFSSRRPRGDRRPIY